MCILTRRKLKKQVKELNLLVADLNGKLERSQTEIGILERIGESKDGMIRDLQSAVARLKSEVADYEGVCNAMVAELSRTPARGKDGRYCKRED